MPQTKSYVTIKYFAFFGKKTGLERAEHKRHPSHIG